jgi:peptidoglycan/LPS O-acetylase OafA/YrhL
MQREAPSPAAVAGAGPDGGAGRRRACGHIEELDGVRGIAILMVFLFHYVGIVRTDTPALTLASWVAASLWVGVDLFFVLSGFLITGILLDAKGDRRGYFRTFYARRALRIFPLYYGALLIIFFALPPVGLFRSPAGARLLENQGWLWCHAANIKAALDGPQFFMTEGVYLHHFWSLSVEEQFYLAWPLVVYGLGRSRLVAVCVAVIVLSPALRLGVIAAGLAPGAGYMLTPCRLDALGTGALLAVLVRGGVATGAFGRPAAWLLGVGGVILAGLFVRGGGLRWEDPVTLILGLTAMAAWSAGLILAAIGLRPAAPLRRALRASALRGVGKYSYGIYVIHLIIYPAYESFFGTQILLRRVGSYPLAGVIHALLAFGITFGLAYLSYHLIEVRFLRLKRFFEYRPAPEKPAAARAGASPAPLNPAAASAAGSPRCRPPR